MYRWVRYEAPVMVCVAVGNDGEQVTVVVIGEEPGDIRLACSHDGHPLVYDEHMELLGPGDATAQAAIREAEDRDWPDPSEWEGGPDALHHPGSTTRQAPETRKTIAATSIRPASTTRATRRPAEPQYARGRVDPLMLDDEGGSAVAVTASRR
jgi:hypothetical protein